MKSYGVTIQMDATEHFGIVFYAVQGGCNFWNHIWNFEILGCDHSNETSFPVRWSNALGVFLKTLPYEFFSFNRPFYRYGGHIEVIRFKEYYRMPRGNERISFVFSSGFRDIFS